MFTYTYIYYKIYIHPEAQIVLCKQAVNRWTDNTFAVKVGETRGRAGGEEGVNQSEGILCQCI